MRRAAAACALLLGFAGPAAAQQQPADIRGEFERLVSQIEALLDRPLEPDTRDMLRKRLAPLAARLETETDDDRAGEAFRLERRLVRLRENRRGTFDNIPPALFEAYQRALEDEERRLVDALRRLGRPAE